MIDYNLPMEKYLAHPGISSSKLKNILFTPADYRAADLAGKNDETKYTIRGEAIHTAILEPDYLESRFALQPADWGPKNKNPGMSLWKEFKKLNAGKKIIEFKDAQLIQAVVRAATWHQELAGYLEHGRPEVTAFVKMALMKNLPPLEYKARTDLLYENGNRLEMLDVKTTGESMTDDNLFKIIFNNGYHFQAAHHSFVFTEALGRTIDAYRWVFVSTETHAVHIRIVLCPPELLAWGYRDHEYATNRLIECIEKDEWPGYSPEVTDLKIPEWARRVYE